MAGYVSILFLKEMVERLGAQLALDGQTEAELDCQLTRSGSCHKKFSLSFGSAEPNPVKSVAYFSKATPLMWTFTTGV